LPKINYNILPVDPIGLEVFSDKDVQVVEQFKVNTTYDAIQHKIELHVYTEDSLLIDSYYDYRNEKLLQGSETAGTTGASQLTIDPEQDAVNLGYSYGGVSFVYNFLDNLYSENIRGGEFFIEEISEDRTEVRLLTNQVEEEAVVEYTNNIKQDLASTSYFNEFRLNLKGNDLIIGINIDNQDYRDYKSVIVKLYEPLPLKYDIKDLLTVERIISDTVGFKINTTVIPDEIKVPYLKGPNFSVDDTAEQNSPTDFLNYNDLFSFPTNNTYREINSRFNEKGIEVSVDYSNFDNFIQFSSAEERIRNFQYKLNLIDTYQSASNDRNSGSLAVSPYLTGSSDYYKGKINTIIDNFDHYDRHLYFNSGSTSWPKQSSTKPYLQATGATTSSYFNEIILSASNFDTTNVNQLLNTIPEYLREDPDSINYNTFINMLAQHFDNIWVYAKSLSDKYDNDNRLDYGISKDLVQDTLRNFGVKVYNNFRSTDDLFSTFTGQLYASESIHQTVISASNDPISIENYRRDISKRVYHNLPLLLKSKGTERGLKALIASFGVPTDSNISHLIGADSSNIPGLYVRTIGGNITSGSINFGPSFEFTSSNAKIKIDNTGSIVDGSTLSQYTSITEREDKFSDDIHTVEVGFSPTYELNKNIISRSGNFNIDNIIGDPRIAYSSSYQALVSQSKNIITESTTHHYGEFVRSLKFYDNVLFKMIKDFVPARANINTGIIIKPHLLERNKIKQVQLSHSLHYHTSSIETNNTTGSSGGSFTDQLSNELATPLTASYTENIITPLGPATISYHLKERARYDGELSGSYIQLVKTDGDINDDNTWKYKSDTTVSYKGELVELITCPTVTTTTLNNTTLLAINATSSMDFSSNAARGFVFSSTITSPTISNTSSFHSSGSTPFSMSLNNLQTGSWYIRGYSQTEDCGIIYGDVQNLSITCPTVSTSTESSIGSGSFVANGNYSDLGTGAFISKGFIFWSGSATPIEIGNGNIISRSIDINTSTGAYSFLFADGPEHTVADDSAYYYRAYASSSICTAYGDVEAVTTVDEIQTLATASFFVSTDTFANVAGLQASQVCGLGGTNYNPEISAAVSIKVYVSASAMPGNNLANLSAGDQIFYSEGANANLPLNDVNSAARLFGLGEINGHRPNYWALVEGVGDGANNGKIITDPGEYPGNPGIFSTGSICTV